MRLRGRRTERAVDRGFVLSDHADWGGLTTAIEATGAERVWVTHGHGEPLARWLVDRGLDAVAVETRFRDGEEDPEEGSGSGGRGGEEPNTDAEGGGA